MGILEYSQYVDFSYFFNIYANILITVFAPNPINGFTVIHFKNEKEEQNWFIYESKGEHPMFHKLALWISLPDKL